MGTDSYIDFVRSGATLDGRAAAQAWMRDSLKPSPRGRDRADLLIGTMRLRPEAGDAYAESFDGAFRLTVASDDIVIVPDAPTGWESVDTDTEDTCEVCDRSGPAAQRCAFGHRSGPCSCWRGVPC